MSGLSYPGGWAQSITVLVTAVHPDGQGGGLDVLTPAGTLHAEHVILAVPPALALERIDFSDALPADLVRLTRSTPVWMGAVAKVVAQYPSAFWRQPVLDGRLHRASTETATHHAGHIEGALAAGERAAQAVLVAPGPLLPSLIQSSRS